MKKPTFAQLDSFTQGYIEALFFTELPEHRHRPGDIREWFDFSEAWHQLTRRVQNVIRQDCDDFQAQPRVQQLVPESDKREAGRDFWFTRNRHGCGFWDGDWPDHGRELTELSRPYGTQETYWHKGRLYFHGMPR